jgi:long-chain acyl-CoA synthetase
MPPLTTITKSWASYRYNAPGEQKMADTSTTPARPLWHLFRPSLPYPLHSYAELLSMTAERYPEQVALHFEGGSLTYRELNALVNTCANGLLDMGIKAGERVCLLMTNRPEYVISWFAVSRIGAIASPMNPSHKEREVIYQLNDSEATAIIVEDTFMPMVQLLLEQTPALRFVIAVGEVPEKHASLSFNFLLHTYPSTPFFCAESHWEDLAALPYSSGTTGQPKGVMLTHKNLVCNAYQSIATARISVQDRMLVFLPLYHIYGIMLMGLAASTGATMVLMERFDARACLENIQAHGITLLYVVPQIVSALMNFPQLDEFDLHTVRFAQCGAAPLPPALARAFQDRTHITLLPAYGLTEAAPGTHSNPVCDPWLIKIETIGLPIHDTKQKIVDIETGLVELGVGQEGELIVQGPQVMLGYWKAPEATAAALRDGWLYTGDIGWCDEQGYVTVTDRKKEMIKYKGFSIAPAQIEALLLEHPAVADAAVVAKEKENVGEIPKAFVALNAGYTTGDLGDVVDWVNRKLATYKHIREIEAIDGIPRNPSGKILRRVLRDREKQKSENAAFGSVAHSRAE